MDEPTMVTPAMAMEWLKLNVDNRPVSDNRVRNFERAITDGRFRLTSDAIGFDKTGKLINGQHRLLACIRADQTIPLHVARSLPVESFLVMDRGTRRTAAQALRMRGISNATIAASGARIVLVVKNDWFGRSANDIDHEMIYGQVMDNMDAYSFWTHIGALKPTRSLRLPGGSTTAFGVLGEAKADRDDLEAYIHAVITAENLTRGDPRLAVHNWFINRNQRENGGRRNIGCTAVLIKGFVRWIDGVETQHMRPWRFGEPFPTFEA